MAEAAGLALGVVATWKTCVEVFDVVDGGKKYGMDYEVLRVKLEVERVRLLMWGNGVGLGDMGGVPPRSDSWLHREELRGTVVRVLGCIQQVFDHTERLEDRYGLRPATPLPEGWEEGAQPTQSQLILGTVFKRAYEILRKSASNRQRETPLRKKTLWAVHDRTKFQRMVTEIKGFNDNLESLFPDLKAQTAHQIRNDIEVSEDISALQSLQEAAQTEHEEISDCASIRLEALGATTTARSRMSDNHTVTEDEPVRSGLNNMTGIAEALVEAKDGNASDATEEIGNFDELPNELAREMNAVETYTAEKNKGCLTLQVLGPQSYSARVTAHTYWDGIAQDRIFATLDDMLKGFVTSSNASFDLYKRRKFFPKARDIYDTSGDRNVLLDVEALHQYENKNPGTVTVEGFGMECWDYEANFGKKRETTIFVSHAKIPNSPAKKLLRRIDELRRGNGKFGWNPKQEEADVQEFFSNMGVTYCSKPAEGRPLSDFYSMLNRTDIFADFTTGSSIALEWLADTESDSIGMWNFLLQIILAKEVAQRIKQPSNSWTSGFTPRILASLIVQDLWLENVEIILVDQKLALEAMTKAETPEEIAKAEDFKEKGNAALKNKKYDEAVDLYTEAMKIDMMNPIYRCNRAAALLALEKWDGAEQDAYVATQLDPKYAKAWSRLGTAQLKLKFCKRAKESFLRAIELSGKDATAVMKQGLEDAKEMIESELDKIGKEANLDKKDELRKAFLEQDWDIGMKTLEIHSRVHEQQVQGLLVFAEKMKWPYINEVRDFAEGVYGDLRAGSTVPLHLYDWLFGLTLPGQWMSFKIMSALIIATPSIREKCEVAHYYECGIALPRRSYWRLRTVLGRVLGCLPNVNSLCGWIGPCPRVEFDPPLSNEAEDLPRHIRLKARHVAPMDNGSIDDDGMTHIGGRNDPYEATRMKPDEDIPAYLAEMKDDDKWISPEPPVRDLTTVTVKAIRLKRLPLEVNIAAKAANKSLTEKEVNHKTHHRASIVFTFDSNVDTVTYTLYTNPVFVTPPACKPTQGVAHEVHFRELPNYQRHVWTVDQLKEHTPEDADGDVMVINATGKGAEVLARAWCSERSKNAVIRRAGGPCFVCAVRAASKAGLGVGILIWVS